MVFIGAYLFTRLCPDWISENFTRPPLIGKSIATLMVAAGLVFFALGGKSQSSRTQKGMHSGEPLVAALVEAVTPWREPD